jgi:hypothetical protein
MKRVLFVLTAALLMVSCFKDPPTTSRPMYYYETLCNDPWGKALTTNSDTVAAWLTKQKITFENVSIQGEIFPGAASRTNCDTLTNRRIIAAITFADTAKAAAAGFTGR